MFLDEWKKTNTTQSKIIRHLMAGEEQSIQT